MKRSAHSESGFVVSLVYIIIVIFLMIGEVKCIVKAVKCDWEPIGKAEIVYTVAACTGVGSIVGWINIED